MGLDSSLGRQGYEQWCRSLLSIGGIICNFTPILPFSQHWGGMNLDHDFAQMWKFSEDQKKMQMEHFFSPNSGENPKKRSSSKIEHFFPQIFALM